MKKAGVGTNGFINGQTIQPPLGAEEKWKFHWPSHDLEFERFAPLC